MNKTIILLRLGRDAEVKEINGRFAINFTGAWSEKFTNRDGVKEERTTWYDCAIWRDDRSKTSVAQYLTKGTQVIVEGRVSARVHEGKAYMRIDVMNFTLCGGGQKQEQQPNQQDNNDNYIDPPPSIGTGATPFPDDGDLPF